MSLNRYAWGNHGSRERSLTPEQRQSVRERLASCPRGGRKALCRTLAQLMGVGVSTIERAVHG